MAVAAPKKWNAPKRDKQGRELAKDGLPRAASWRAKALAEKGKETDELGICSDDQIATAKAAKDAAEKAKAPAKAKGD